MPQTIDRERPLDDLERRAAPEPLAAPERREGAPPAPDWADLFGARGLAVLGGLAMLVGLVLLAVLTAPDGELSPGLRLVLAAAGSAAVFGGGIVLHSRYARDEAARALTGAGAAGLFTTLIMAGDCSHLISGWLMLLGALAVSAVTTALAIRWAGQTVAALGLLGAVGAPLAVPGPLNGLSLALLVLATAAAIAVVVRQGWGWLGLGALLLAEPQAGVWAVQQHDQLGAAGLLAPLAALALLAVAGAAGLQRARWRQDHEAVENRAVAAGAELSRAGVAMLTGSALLVGGFSVLACGLGGTLTPAAGVLAAAALVHAALAGVPERRAVWLAPLRPFLFAVALTLGDVAYGLLAHGVLATIGWGAAAFGCAALARRQTAAGGRTAAQLGLGAELAILLARALTGAPPSALGGNGSASGLVAVAMLAAACAGCSRVAGARSVPLSSALDVLGLGALIYLTGLALGGPALVAAWCAEATAIGAVAARTDDRLAALGAGAFLAAAACLTFASQAPPRGLVLGVPHLWAAAVSLTSLAIAGWRLVPLAAPPSQRALRAGLVLIPLYLASVAVITAFQPSPGGELGVLDLGVRQEGQVILSAMWALAGLGGLVAGLRHGHAGLRSGALALLLAVSAKVFLYDLSTLTALYRVVSCIVLGALLLTAAFAYAQLRASGLSEKNPGYPEIQ